MKPYYEDKYATIYHGDCRYILPNLKNVDLVITDPPYGMNYVSNSKFIKHDRIINDDKLPIDIINLSILKSNRAAYFFCRWNNLIDMPKPKSVIAWIKNNWTGGDLKHEHGRQWEACCFYPKENHEFRKRIPDVIMAKRQNTNSHPTEKPLELISRLIECNVCDSVLDPYMGVGTTLLAAKNNLIKSIGIEIELKYCEIAAKRLSQEVFDFND